MDSNLDTGCLLRKIFPKEPPHRTIRQTGLYRHHNLRFQLIAIWWVRVLVFHFCNSLCTQYILPDQNHLFWQHYSLPGVYFWKIGESYNTVIFDSLEKTSKPSRTLRKGALTWLILLLWQFSMHSKIINAQYEKEKSSNIN